MNISNFFREVCQPKFIILAAIGGGVSGRFCNISPLQGAVYAVAGSLAYRVAHKINGAICNKIRDKNFNDFIKYPLDMACVYFSYLAGNKALSFLGKQIALETAFKVSIIAGITGLCINYAIGKIFGDTDSRRIVYVRA